MSFQYIMRRTLPLWSCEDNLNELDSVMKRYRVDELLIKVDTEEFSHGQPELDWLHQYRKVLERTSEICKKNHVRFSLNPWITTGHTDRGRQGAKQLPGLQTVVDINGNQSTVCACQLCRIWQENTRKVWQYYAELDPYAIWIEDDIRNANHGAAQYGCFCQLHRERFAREQQLPNIPTLQEMKEAVFQYDKVHPWRPLYLDMLNRITIETVHMLRSTVHSVNPDIHIGLMSSGGRYHTAEGRDWKTLMQELDAGKSPAFHRPTLGLYSETAPFEFRYCLDSIQLSRYAAGNRPEFTEVENIPYSRFTKSACMTGAEILISAACGCAGAALNCYDHFGSPLELEPLYGKTFRKLRPNADALMKEAKNGKFRGLKMFHRDNAGKTAHLPENAGLSDLMESGFNAAMQLRGCGYGITYDHPDAEVSVLTGELVRSFENNELDELLDSGCGLLLDSKAAAILLERGFGKKIGLEAVTPPRHPEEFERSAAEEFLDPENPEHRQFVSAYVPVYGPNTRISGLKLLPGARAVSRLCDCDAKELLTMSAIFTNDSGTRIAIHGMVWDDGAMYSPHFLSPIRVRQMEYLMKYLYAGEPDFRVTGDSCNLLGLCVDQQSGTTLAGAFNLSCDLCSKVVFHLGKSNYRKVEVLKNGKWHKQVPVRWENGKLELKCRLQVYGSIFIRLS